uniref:Putative Synaptojanin, N-terminal n=1 Tax=Davidia involucrata TaxID=16924 RepID=A0A5B6YUG1_DAVIN
MASENEQQAWIEEEPTPSAGYLQKFRLYETRSNFYMIGRDKNRTFWRVLKIDRLELSELNILEDSTAYSEMECYDLLKRVHEGNKSTGGLKFVTTCYGIVGFIKFLGPYYMLLITKRRKIGTICGHAVYAITKSEMIPIPNSTVRSNMAYSKNENRSFVNSACKCKMYLVLIRRPKRLVFRITYNPFVSR